MKGKRTESTLDMHRLLKDVMMLRLGISLPDHYVRTLDNREDACPLTSDEERIEEVLITFFTTYLNNADDDSGKKLAETYGISEEEVALVRQGWMNALKRYRTKT